MRDMEHDETRSLREWYTYGRQVLAASGIEEAGTDARILLEYAADIDRSYYYLHMHDPLGNDSAGVYAEYLCRRIGREPVQYIVGEAPFYGNMFLVTPDVLIPRQDTEILVQEAEKRLIPGMRILDLCTGSGCILLSLLNQYSITGTGSDISAAALAVAEKNRKKLGLQAEWVESDLFSEIGGQFDMIVSNPPYIASDVLPDLQPEVIRHEPVRALDGGEGGLEILATIIQAASSYLKDDGWLLLEIGYDQGDAVRKMLQQQRFIETDIIRDLENRDRVAAGRRPQGADSL